ncbi:Uncharacterised protein [Vibrio cholerae]|nr:Uncharacterised protein [Vibrio cholerae]CSC98623.1 Uncharacterised protein [Vibrio cholerae]
MVILNHGSVIFCDILFIQRLVVVFMQDHLRSQARF